MTLNFTAAPPAPSGPTLFLSMFVGAYAPRLALLFASVAAVYFVRKWHLWQTARKPDDILNRVEILGVPGGFFAWARALFASINSMGSFTRTGYERYCKAQNRPFAVPSMWTGNPLIVLPPSQLHLVNKPDGVINGFRALIDTLHLTYFFDRDILENPIHFEVARKDVNKRNVQRLAVQTADEVQASFRDLWGTDTENWMTVNGWEICCKLITRIGLRSILGETISGNDKLTEASRKFADAVIVTGGILNCVPPFVRPVVGYVLALRARYYGFQFRKLLVPLIRERIMLWKRVGAGKDDNVPEDYLQWLIPRCAVHGVEHLDPDKMASRLLATNVMFIFGVNYVFFHLMIDICSSAEKKDILEGIREEAQRIAGRSLEGLARKETVDQLYRADSAARESMRISTIAITSIPRDIMGTAPLDIGNGILAPPGTRVVFPTQPIHLDSSIYEDAERFDAFRFSRPYEDASRSVVTEDEARQLIVTLEPSFLVFGYGKRACPGRWLVSQTLKQTLSFLATHYDVDIDGPAPKRRSVANIFIPAADTKFKIKRRHETPNGKST